MKKSCTLLSKKKIPSFSCLELKQQKKEKKKCFDFVVGIAAVAGIFFHATDTSHRRFLAPQSGFLSSLSEKKNSYTERTEQNVYTKATFFVCLF